MVLMRITDLDMFCLWAGRDSVGSESVREGQQNGREAIYIG